MSSFLDGLRHYFETTPKEKILEDWAMTAQFEGVGITVEELLPTAYSYALDIGESQKISANFNPEFSSGFFITNHLSHAKFTQGCLFIKKLPFR